MNFDVEFVLLHGIFHEKDSQQMKELTKEELYTLFKIKKRVDKTIRMYGLIEENDKILIGLSGGKDSLALVEILGEKMKIFNPKFSLLAVHISMKNIPYQSDISYLKEHCDKFNIPFIHQITSFDESTDKRKSRCFLCSWNRRKALFEIAKANNCNKIALGHHQDDILETLLMNMTFQGAIGTMPPLTQMYKFDMKIIRPFAMNKETEMMELLRIRQYKLQKKNCPYEKESHRSDMKKLLAEFEKMNPEFRSSMWSAMENIQTDYLPKRIR
jgi:tRNA(Ile)-lysidine synthase TilS/MesJ